MLAPVLVALLALALLGPAALRAGERAARALEARGRRPEAYDALRGGLGEAERKLGVFDATNTAGMQVNPYPVCGR